MFWIIVYIVAMVAIMYVFKEPLNKHFGIKFSGFKYEGDEKDKEDVTSTNTK
jgi:hypothetical protein